MTKTFTEKGIEYLLVEVPDKYECKWLTESFEWVDLTTENIKSFKPLPFNKWENIGFLKDITEEQAKEIVEDSEYYKAMFKDYEYKGYFFTALQSLNSLLESLGIDTSLNWLLLKKI